MPPNIMHLESDSNFVKEPLPNVNVLNDHGVVMRDVLLVREKTPNNWRAFSVRSGGIPHVFICSYGRSLTEAYWQFMRKLNRYRRCSNRKCGMVHKGRVCKKDAIREAFSIANQCAVCTVRTTDIFILACECANACKGCLLRQAQLGDNRCPTCRTHRYTIGAGWKEEVGHEEDEEDEESHGDE